MKKKEKKVLLLKYRKKGQVTLALHVCILIELIQKFIVIIVLKKKKCE